MNNKGNNRKELTSHNWDEPLLITFEGPEGSGKSTLIRKICGELAILGYPVVMTREPGGKNSPIAEQIRSVILSDENGSMMGMTEAYLYAAARLQHIYDFILPKLQEGKIVLCDRYIDSSIVYQGFGRELSAEKILEINRDALILAPPQITFFLDIAPEIGLARIHANPKREINRIDNEPLDFHRLVRTSYVSLASSDIVKNRIKHVVDANKPVEYLTELIINQIIEDAKNF